MPCGHIIGSLPFIKGTNKTSPITKIMIIETKESLSTILNRLVFLIGLISFE
ncbi:unnamed protein product [Meloidogyne enterolobii]|uniref:Uncharacterized protein n=1 Tax=Meloidogyne enterolobii TaxID=390850 RepID=A0ACB0YXQ0_MELEN